MEPQNDFSDILLVDDDKLLCLLSASAIKRRIQLPITTYENGQLALEAILKAPDKKFLVLLDLNMPVMNGWEFLEEINKRQLDNLRVVVVSSSVIISDKIKCLGYQQVLDFLEKSLIDEKLTRLEFLVDQGF